MPFCLLKIVSLGFRSFYKFDITQERQSISSIEYFLFVIFKNFVN